jgi:2-polyprenyl-3-methyl-5-hydroxy-6-metoxy-1,4-benzoquinol methylase
VAGCCNPRGCDQFFSPRFARRVARRYRNRRLDKTARQMVEFLQSRGLDGATVLEVGGGVGEIQLELLKRGAERTVNLELSPAYEHEAARLVHEAGVDQRVHRRIHDIAVDPAAVEPVDIVVLHRVVCCYPDYEQLLSAAADHARRLLVFSHPPRNPISRAIIATQNLGFRVMRREFRTFTHPPPAMLAVLERRGLQRIFTHRGIPCRPRPPTRPQAERCARPSGAERAAAAAASPRRTGAGTPPGIGSTHRSARAHNLSRHDR